MTTQIETYNPFLERNVKHPTTDVETLMHLVKGALGAGIMAMPSAYQHIGLWIGIPWTVFVCFIATYCIHMLVRASQTLCFRCRIPRLSYADTAEQAFRTDPKELIKLAVIMRFIVSIFLVINSLGIVCIYFINVGRNLQQVIAEHSNIDINLRVWICILTVPMLFLCLIHNLKYLAPFSMAANFMISIGLMITCYFIFDDLPSPSERTAVAELRTWPSFFSISMFALENVGVVIPCENEMKTPEHFTGCPSVLVVASSIVGLLYTFVGFFGCLKYGEGTESNISLNLPPKNILAQSVKIMFALGIYFTILLQYYVALQIVWRAIRPKVPENRLKLVENCTRVSLMLLCSLFAVAFPDLGPFIELVGAITFSTLGLTLPAIISLVVFRIEPGYGFLKIHLIKDILIITLGVGIFITGTRDSLQKFNLESFSIL